MTARRSRKPSTPTRIVEPKETAGTLDDTLERLRLYVQCMPLAFVVWDRSLRVIEWNPSAERLFGYCGSEAVGMRADAVFAPDSLRGAEVTVHALRFLCRVRRS